MKLGDIHLWAASVADAQIDAHDDVWWRRESRSPSQQSTCIKRPHLPTPPPECCPSTAHGSESEMCASPKRRRTDDRNIELNVTPRARPAASAFDGAEELHFSAPSSTSYPSKGSSVSRSSSPNKQFAKAELQPTGFHTASFHDHVNPPSLDCLGHDLMRIRTGHGILPNNLKAELADEKGIFAFAFSNYDDIFSSAPGDDGSSSAFQYPSLQQVRLIYEHARECREYRLGESSWNMDVHARLLEWVLRTSPGSEGPLDYRYCTTAAIIPSYTPKNAPSKMVDFCLAIKLDSNEVDVINNHRRIRPGLSINHTDWGDLDRRPIAISIETKRNTDYDSALLQMATWHAAQWRSLLYGATNLRRIEFLPGIIVTGHEWYFVATVSGANGKPTTLEKLSIGSTASLLEIYMLIASLHRLRQWAETTFWPAFREDLLGLAAGEG